MKQVDDDVDEIQQHPAALRHTFIVMHGVPFALENFHDVLSGAAYVRVRRSTCYDKEVGHVTDSRQVEDHHVLGFVVEADGGDSLSELGRLGAIAYFGHAMTLVGLGWSRIPGARDGR